MKTFAKLFLVLALSSSSLFANDGHSGTGGYTGCTENCPPPCTEDCGDPLSGSGITGIDESENGEETFFEYLSENFWTIFR